MKINKIILTILILSTIALIFSGCGGGNPVIPPPDDTEDSEIPESTEVISQKIDLSVGGTIEVTDQESPINGVKLIIPPTSSNKNVKDSIATIIISYIDDPYSLKLPGNQGFLLPPIVVNSDTILDTYCTLEIPYTEDDLSNAGVSSGDTIKVYRYNYATSSWEEIEISKGIHKSAGDTLKMIFKPEYIDKPISCTILNSYPPSDLGLPQPGDLLYKLSLFEGWRPGHVGIYVGELVYDGVIYYNVIEALSKGVKRTYKNPISTFSGSDTYMGARQPESGALTSKQREDVIWYVKDKVDKKYAWGQSVGILFGMLQGNLVKGALGTYNCVGLAEAAYEYAGVNLISDLDEGNGICIFRMCVLTPAEQYNKTKPAEGYTVSGQVTDSQGNGIPNVILNFELVSFNDYHNSVEVITNSGGYWSSNKLGREWNVTPQKDGYTFEPSTLHEGWVKSKPSTWIVKKNANNINFTGIYNELNHSPIITSSAVTSATKGQSYSYDVNATDSDGDTLTYSLTTKPSGMSINSSTGLITWIPIVTGSFGVTVKASDGELFDTQSFTVTVEETGTTTPPPNPPTSLSPGTTSAPGPTISTLTPTLQWQAVSNADYYNLSVSIYPYGTSNIIYYNQQVYGNSITIPSGKLEAGKKYRWNMRAYNSAGYSDYSLDYYFQTAPLPSTQVERITNGSFSSGTSGWTLVSDFWAGTYFFSYHTSPGYAAGGVDSAGLPKNSALGWMYQTVAIPSGATSATLSFWYNITSEETGSTAYDILNITIQNSVGNYLATVAVLSNLNKSSLGSYNKVTFNATSYKGQTIRVHFLASTDSSVYTVFRIDDVSLMSDG